MTIYDVMKEVLSQAQSALVVTAVSGPSLGTKTLYREDGQILYGPAIEGFNPNGAKVNQLLTLGETEYFVEAVEKDPSVLVLGAGHVSRAITDLLLFIGCKVTVLDLNTWCQNSLTTASTAYVCLWISLRISSPFTNIMVLSLLLGLTSMIISACLNCVTNCQPTWGSWGVKSESTLPLKC